jgi:hypothetical protein
MSRKDSTRGGGSSEWSFHRYLKEESDNRTWTKREKLEFTCRSFDRLFVAISALTVAYADSVMCSRRVYRSASAMACMELIKRRACYDKKNPNIMQREREMCVRAHAPY